MDSVIARLCLPAPNDGVDVEWVDFEAVAASAYTLRRHQRGAAAHKGIKNQIATRGTVEDGIGDQLHRLGCRVQRKQVAFLGATAHGVGARIVPDIASITAEATELNVVAMGCVSILEDEYKLVLTAIERAHAGVGFYPDAGILVFEIDRAARRQ